MGIAARLALSVPAAGARPAAGLMVKDGRRPRRGDGGFTRARPPAFGFFPFPSVVVADLRVTGGSFATTWVSLCRLAVGIPDVVAPLAGVLISGVLSRPGAGSVPVTVAGASIAGLAATRWASLSRIAA